MILKLYDKENTYTFNVDDLNRGEKLYYKFQFTTANVANGKYNMVLTDDDGNVIAEDVVCIGDFNAETIQYNRGENVYINSPLNANLEDVRTITIDVPSYTVYPSEGYDAMKEVVVNAQPVYDNGYNEGENIGYNSGYTAGDADGYNRGYNEGETTQKAKLTNITITNNGTYTSEDGYGEVVVDVPDLNGDYNEGYDAGKVDGYDSGYTAGIDYASENAEEIAAENAIDLVATEFGTYYTKYSDNIVNPNPVTGIYPDGETLHNSAQLINNKYNTGLIPTTNTKLEIWFKPELAQKGYIIGTQKPREADSIFKMFFNKDTGKIETELAGNRVDLQNIGKQWYYLEMSFADGLWANGVKIGDYTANISGAYNIPFGINFLNDVPDEPSQSNGNFGMIKITTDGITNVIIPTEDGFKNITTDEMLEVVYNEGTYDYINNNPTILPNLIKSVDVQPKIDVAATGLRFGYSTFTEVPSWADFSNTTDMSGLFNSCSKLQSFPQIDTSNVLKMMNLFYGCSSLQTIPLIDTSKVTIMEALFAQCTSLITIPQLDTRSVQNMHQMFYYCTSLTSIPPLKANNLNMPETYRGIFGYSELTKLTDFGGLIGLKCRLIGDYNFNRLPNLTYESCINILNGLYDFTGNGETPASNQGQLKVHPNFLTTVGDEISIGVLKGWSISA